MLNDFQNDYLLAPGKIEIKESMLSDYFREIANKQNFSVGGVKELVPNLGNKDRYILPYRILRLHLQLGMKMSLKNPSG